MKFSHILFALYIIVFPFYFFERGNPQVADLFGVLIIVANIKNILLHIKSNIFTKALFLFVIYTILVNTIWMSILGEVIILKSSFYYLYSYFFLLVFYTNINDKRFLDIIVMAISASLAIQFLLWPFVASQGVRSMMFFKDPNQLSFWSFSMLIISYLVSRLANPKPLLLYAMLLLSTFFIFISASKSGLFGCVVFWIYFLVKTRRQIYAFVILAAIAVTFLIALDKINLNSFDLINDVVERVSEKKATGGGSGLEDRGYDRITKFPQYLLFGAGEGEYERFNYRIELHSTFFNILFSYGFIGLSIFAFALIAILRRSSLSIKLILLIIVLYTLAHMTLRIPLFWITLLLLYCLNQLDSKKLLKPNNDEG
jgi:hypothetical protein